MVNKSDQSQNGGFQFGRSIVRETVIPADEGIIIAAPENQSGMDAAQMIKERFHGINCKVTILSNPEHDLLLHCNQPVIVIGNLEDSKCVKYMYYKYLSMTDRSYPGKGGYHLKTLVNPFSTGHNVIHIGYSDESGLHKGLDKFLRYISNPIPFLHDNSYTNLPFSNSFIEKVRNESLPKTDLIPSIHTSFWYETGMLYYLTGEREPFLTYLAGWDQMIEISKANDYLIRETHLYMMRHIEIWRLLEFSGLIPDSLRGKIEECLFRWGMSSEGIEYARPRSKEKYLPAHNHTMFCALSLLYLHDYFTKRYPDLGLVSEWKTVSDDVFYTFNSNGWKPYCDDSSYSNQVTLVLVCNYSIFQDEHLFLNSSAKQAAEWIKTIIGQNGILPSFGDGSVKSPFPTAVSSIFAHYLKDGEIAWLYHRFIRENKDYEIHFTRLFDSGIKPVEPNDPSAISCIPLDKTIYDVWNHDPEAGKRLTMTPPYGPYEDCFDKVSIRTGRDPVEDDFLLIDGLGSNGIHSYSDTLGILDYTCKGIVWLVEENDYRWPEPENCSILTVAKEGYASDIPGYGLMEEKKMIADGQYYLRMRSKNYNGIDWVREIFLVKGRCVVFHDTVICEQEGEYVIAVHFRTPARAWMDQNTLKSKRRNKNNEIYELRLSSYGSVNIHVNLEEIPYGERLFNYGGMYDRKNHLSGQREMSDIMWEARYNSSEVVVSSMTTFSSLSMQKGDKLSFTHVVHPAKEKDNDIHCIIDEGLLRLSYDKEEYLCPIVHVGSEYKRQAIEKNEQTKEKIEIRKLFDLPHAVKNTISIGHRQFICSMIDGHIAFVHQENIVREVILEGEIHTMEYIASAGIIAVGHGKNKLSALDLHGKTLWEAQVNRIPTLFSSWELSYPKIVKIRSMESKDGTLIVAGCGDNQIRIFNTKGEMFHVFYLFAMVPDCIEIVDIDGDGEPEIVSTGKDDSCHGVFRIRDVKGNVKRDIWVNGWLCTIRSHHLIGGNGKFKLVTGNNYGTNFKIFDIENGNPKAVCEKSLGGMVNSVLFNDERNMVCAGTSKGSVLGFDMGGNHLWHAYVKDSVMELFNVDNHFIAVCINGKISAVSSMGIVTGEGAFPDKPACCIRINNNVIVGCGNAVYIVE